MTTSHLTTVPAPDASTTPWMTEREAAAYTGFTRNALASMRYEHRGPAWSKPNNRVRYHRDDIDAWMREGRRTA